MKESIFVKAKAFANVVLSFEQNIFTILLESSHICSMFYVLYVIATSSEISILCVVVLQSRN